jgi:hypothetical protein
MPKQKRKLEPEQKGEIAQVVSFWEKTLINEPIL